MNSKIVFALCSVLFLASCGKKMEEVKPIRKDITENVFAAGILEAKNTYTLTAQTDGYLSAVNFEEGDFVKTGKILAIVDNKESSFNSESAKDLYDIAERNTQNNAPALLQAQNSIALNKQKMEQDFVQYQRYQKLWEANSIAKIEVENSELQYKNSKIAYESALEYHKQLKQQAEQQVISHKASKNVNNIVLGKNQITALVSGKVYKKHKQTGDFVKRGEAIALIGDAQNIYAKVNIDESNIVKVKIGQKAVVQLNVNKHKAYNATVLEILPSFDEASQSFICKLSFDEPLDFVIVNTQLQSNIIIGTQKNVMLIPRNYLDFGGFVQVKGNKEKTKVKTAIVSNEWVQILDGINDDTLLITENLASNNIKTSEAGAMTNR